MKTKISICFLLLTCLFGCSDETSTASPEPKEVCEYKLLGFDDVQYDPYYEPYYATWLEKACTSKRVGEPCHSYNLSYQLEIIECQEVK